MMATRKARRSPRAAPASFGDLDLLPELLRTLARDTTAAFERIARAIESLDQRVSVLEGTADRPLLRPPRLNRHPNGAL